MNYTIVGLFHNQNKAAKVSFELESAGIKDSAYIIYRTIYNTDTANTSVWKRIFKSSKNETLLSEAQKLITSVEIHTDAEMDAVKDVFNQNEVVHTYEFQDMRIDEAKDLSHIKKIIQIRAKSQTFKTPSCREFITHEGISSEVRG